MKTCVLTFDDGFLSHYNFVRPILLENGYTGTFFVTGTYTARRVKTRQPVKVLGYSNNVMAEFMSWSEIYEMHTSGFEIGNHLAKHVDMTKRKAIQLHAYARALDEHLAKFDVPKTQTIAYPGFCVDRATRRFAKEYGFKFARSGCGKTHDFDSYQFGSYGSGFNKADDPMDVNCTFVFGEKYRANDFIDDFIKLKEDECPILCFHDFRQKGLSVDIPKEDFVKIIEFLKKEQYQTVAFKDLGTVI